MKQFYFRRGVASLMALLALSGTVVLISRTFDKKKQ